MRYSKGREKPLVENITLSLPIGTPAAEVLDMWISAVVARVGTQKKAAQYLDIAAATVSKRLSHRRVGTKSR
jgi:hypothetical protein